MKENKSNMIEVSIIKVVENDLKLNRRIPILAIQQGIAHDTILPNKRKYFDTMRSNFSNAIKNKEVEVWMIESPCSGVGAVFLSNLTRNNRLGIQMEDVIVRESFRGCGLGTSLIEFTAALASFKGLEFVAWECGENNPVQKLYEMLGATLLKNFRPYRIARTKLNHILDVEPQPSALGNHLFSISSRFSIFRAANFGITGFDMNPLEKAYGLQIEDINSESLNELIKRLINVLSLLEIMKEIYFVDLIIDVNSKIQSELVNYFELNQNAYTTDSSCLWELKGEAFKNAAIRGQKFLRL